MFRLAIFECSISPLLALSIQVDLKGIQLLVVGIVHAMDELEQSIVIANAS